MGGIGLLLVVLLVTLIVSTLIAVVGSSLKVVDDPVEAAAQRVECDLAVAEDFARDPDPRWLQSTPGAWMQPQERDDARAHE